MYACQRVNQSINGAVLLLARSLRSTSPSMAHLSISLPAVVIIAALMLRLSATSGATPVIGMPGCETRCGNMSVPYPFGMGPARCYWPGFNLTCNRSSNPPRLLLGDGTLQVVDISLKNGTVRAVHAGDIKIDADGNGTFGGGLRDECSSSKSSSCSTSTN